MNNIVFVRTRHNYGSYIDWFRLAELSGYPIIYVDEMQQHDSTDTVFVISPVNGEWNTRPKHYTKGRVILYQLEWNWDGEHDDPPSADEIWCGDKWHAEKHEYKYVPIGSHAGLNESPTISEFGNVREWDVALMMYRDPPRRARLIQEIQQSGLSISPDGWGIARSGRLILCRSMVAIHQLDNMPTIAPLRMCIAAAHRLAVISEQIADPGIFAGMVDHFSYGDLARMTANIVRDPFNRLREQGEALYHALCVDYTFRQSIERAL